MNFPDSILLLIHLPRKAGLSIDGCMAATSEVGVIKVSSSMDELHVVGTTVLILFL